MENARVAAGAPPAMRPGAPRPRTPVGIVTARRGSCCQCESQSYGIGPSLHASTLSFPGRETQLLPRDATAITLARRGRSAHALRFPRPLGRGDACVSELASLVRVDGQA